MKSKPHTMQFCRANKIAAYDMSKKILFLFLRAESTSQNFTIMFYVGEGIASGKHVAQTADQSERTWKGQLKGQTKWGTLGFE